ncbi:metallophosphoesterase [Nocardioides allogilvus]|uniref:metallophosphoesterase n=1 Tax=Nocardioides allogilvus TaxID=2072017 RepID=UPI000D311A44|nr:metallophosphoesterase [Nocardioides allogilvus]
MRLRRPGASTRRALTGLVLTAVCLTVGVSSGLAFFLGDSRTVVVASHDAVVTPTFDGQVSLRTGPLLPDVRRASGGPVGVDLVLGKTQTESVEELFARYAFIASEPDSQVAKVSDAVRDMASSAALRGLALGLVPLATWWLLGPHRRGQLFRGVRTRKGVLGGVLLLTVPLFLWQPWASDEDTQEAQGEWEPLETFMAGFPVPEEAAGIEIRNSPTTVQTQRLIQSAVDTYDKSKEFYDAAAEEAESLELNEPDDDETVALVVSDRHDNIGMDRVARAIGDQAGASVVLDAGDDTSTGQPWEAFSLDSLDRTFDDLDRFAVAGNHDNGPFVTDYLDDLGWTMLEEAPVEAPWGGLLLGVDDPRSSGLGNWRDETGLSFTEVGERLADAACDQDGERISTLLVHDANLGREALTRGCVDLVVGGHTHVQDGPTEVLGENGRNGYRITNGTTGGAAYAIAIGSKPRRDADVTLVTYRDGRPVGTQWVRLRTDGVFVIGPYAELGLDEPDEE